MSADDAGGVDAKESTGPDVESRAAPFPKPDRKRGFCYLLWVAAMIAVALFLIDRRIWERLLSNDLNSYGIVETAVVGTLLLPAMVLLRSGGASADRNGIVLRIYVGAITLLFLYFVGHDTNVFVTVRKLYYFDARSPEIVSSALIFLFAPPSLLTGKVRVAFPVGTMLLWAFLRSPLTHLCLREWF